MKMEGIKTERKERFRRELGSRGNTITFMFKHRGISVFVSSGLCLKDGAALVSPHYGLAPFSYKRPHSRK